MNGSPATTPHCGGKPGTSCEGANNQKLTTLDAPAVRWDAPSGIIDTGARWEQAWRLLHDETIG